MEWLVWKTGSTLEWVLWQGSKCPRHCKCSDRNWLPIRDVAEEIPELGKKGLGTPRKSFHGSLVLWTRKGAYWAPRWSSRHDYLPGAPRDDQNLMVPIFHSLDNTKSGVLLNHWHVTFDVSLCALCEWVYSHEVQFSKQGQNKWTSVSAGRHDLDVAAVKSMWNKIFQAGNLDMTGLSSPAGIQKVPGHLEL